MTVSNISFYIQRRRKRNLMLPNVTSEPLVIGGDQKKLMSRDGFEENVKKIHKFLASTLAEGETKRTSKFTFIAPKLVSRFDSVAKKA